MRTLGPVAIADVTHVTGVVRELSAIVEAREIAGVRGRRSARSSPYRESRFSTWIRIVSRPGVPCSPGIATRTM